MLDLFQIRYHYGRLEYRQRLTFHATIPGISDPRVRSTNLTVSDKWGPWQDVPAVKGDESDQRWEE